MRVKLSTGDSANPTGLLGWIVPQELLSLIIIRERRRRQALVSMGRRRKSECIRYGA